MDFLSEFSAAGEYEGQTDVLDNAYGLIRDTMNKKLYYAKDDLYAYKYDITTKIEELRCDTICFDDFFIGIDIPPIHNMALNRDGSKLYTVGTREAGSTLSIFTFDTATMEKQTERTISFLNGGGSTRILVDKYGYLWVVTCDYGDVTTTVKIHRVLETGTVEENVVVFTVPVFKTFANSFAIDNNLSCFVISSEMETITKVIVNPSGSLGDGIGGTTPITITLTTPLVSPLDIEALTDGNLVILEHLSTNTSRIRIVNQSGTDIYSTGALAGLYYNLLLDSNGKIYISRTDAAMKGIYVFSKDLSSQVLLKESIGSVEFNQDGTGYNKSVYTGAKI